MNLLYEDIDLEEAKKIQHALSQRVITTNSYSTIKFIAGVDVSYNRTYNKQVAAAVLYNGATQTITEIVTAVGTTTMPYIPGFLSFREVPTILEALKKLSVQPDLLICDGQGIAHPRGLGIASHLGVLLDIPSIGCAKSILVGSVQKINPLRGEQTPLIYHKNQIGMALCTRTGCKPVYISSGHRVSLDTALYWILQLSDRYKLPNIIHMADKISRKTAQEYRLYTNNVQMNIDLKEAL